MKIPLKDIQDFSGNYYELVMAVIIRTEQIVEQISLAEHAISDERVVAHAFNDIFTGKYIYSIEEK
ncbi:DNA-directed RNA polymerase subunit omega [Borrelia miyamotoi]|uniref:DNA-directed RNA polymerase subunit omega n=1 Tax=Borrelia miyamotoi TaxID=47466 RepID=A0AAQ2WVS1_9SPIR|nr:DNA-directed RNA polymerase subunit omega [Borrelia miyamotoi]AGT27759.1 DNA-directed RNA polymerase subunit omega [Borrelia miyamotoi LB-2001]AJA58905.1 DNA-directed RNA polymerase subunit omega [Borrelia miyamotoi]AOW95999.1 DNA-directed RNA polymerase subunit omega [Borrelia miyamotoi]ASQ29541.1 DNA-directed RNA polymerase subunit omega [Borrelia miyamotoi]QTL83897.1 DNA-directed RNA polymerase subunit omega [Borrelia miyamotoi]